MSPYLHEEIKRRLDKERYFPCMHTPGELNNQITESCLRYLADHEENYQTYNDIIGAIECAKLEMYARMVHPYECQKCIDNGDIFPRGDDE